MEGALNQFLGSDPYPRFAYDSALALSYALDELDRKNISLQSTKDLRVALEEDVKFYGVSGFAEVRASYIQGRKRLRIILCNLCP